MPVRTLSGTSISHPMTHRLLFLTPTHASMVPCASFLAGECESCDRSHGIVAPRAALRPYVAPDFR